MFKLVIIGGSAFSTPALFRYLAKQSELPPLTAVLAGRSAARLELVRNACESFVSGVPVRVDTTTSCIQSALSDADIVLIQIRPGGYLCRAFDESFPLKYGQCGDEGLGLGGLAAGWRTWPPLCSILSAVAEACPAALVLLLSSPVGILTRAALTCFPQLTIFGICELPWTVLGTVTSRLQVPLGQIDFDYVGSNHLGWFTRIAYEGRNMIEEYAALLPKTSDVFPSAAVIRDCGAIPTPYLRLDYSAVEVVRQQKKQGQTRGEVLGRMAAAAFSAYASGTESEIIKAVESRPAPWYEHAVGPLIYSTIANSPAPNAFFLSTQHRDYSPYFAADDILEIPHHKSCSGLKCKPLSGPIPAEVKRKLSGFVEYERSATRAVIERSPELLESALASHPWIGESARVPAMAREVSAGALS